MQTFLIAAASAVVAFVAGLFLGQKVMARAVSHLIANGRMREIVEFTESLKSTLTSHGASSGTHGSERATSGATGVAGSESTARPATGEAKIAVAAKPFPIDGWQAGTRDAVSASAAHFDCPHGAWVGVAVADKSAAVCVILPTTDGFFWVYGRSWAWGSWSAPDHGAVIGYVKGMARVNSVGIDRWTASYIGDALSQSGFSVNATRMTRLAMDGPRRELLNLMERGRLLHIGADWGIEASVRRAGAVPSDDGLMTFSWRSLSPDKRERLPIEALTLALAAKIEDEKKQSREGVS